MHVYDYVLLLNRTSVCFLGPKTRRHKTVVANDGAITKQWNGFPTGNYGNHMVGKLLIITAKTTKVTY